jgi:hypothetical protein
MLLQAREYSEAEEDGNLKEFWNDWKRNAYDEDVRSLLESIFNDLPQQNKNMNL